MSKMGHFPSLADSLVHLCGGEKIQSGKHIKPVNQYCSTRLALEGGFPPEWIAPRPMLVSKHITNRTYSLSYSEDAADPSEQPVLGGIKYKTVDLTVVVPEIGPALGVSAKSTGNAFRNLTNRMEEALGECTNVHLMYPGFVFGFLHLIRFATKSDVKSLPDASFDENEQPLAPIRRYHEVLVSLSGRSAITDAGMRYEAVGLVDYRCKGSRAEVWRGYPPEESPVHFSRFFQRLYDLYDLRYAYPDPDGRNVRKEWKVEGSEIPTAFDRQSPFPWELRVAAE